MIISPSIPLNCDGEFYHRLWSEEPGPDYALSTSGGTILPELTTWTHAYAPLTYKDKWIWHMDRYQWDQQHQDLMPPQVIIEESVQVGHCWSFTGPKGHIGIQLVVPVALTQITIYYPNAKQVLSSELRQAPQDIVVWALAQKETLSELGGDLVTRPANEFTQNTPTSLPAIQGGIMVALGNVTYRPEEGKRQSFALDKLLSLKSNVVVIEVTSNCGGDKTCLYRVAVHGKEETPLSTFQEEIKAL
ncbi:Secreted beta-glucosidase sun1 [Stygiomarasmius scandens]|uniref:Secreted beta-glucosidase sun1 n=1 Tax=Marasmiellus scandens TaxID=2682957 RepID=A0ABR1IK98_9AGAR